MARNKLGMIYVIVAAVLWAMTGVIGQILFQQNDIRPIWVVTVRMLFAGMLLLAGGYVRSFRTDRKRLFRVFHHPKDRKSLLIFSVCGSGLVQLSYFYSVIASNAATATFLQYISPAIVVLLSAVMYRQRPSRMELFGTLLAIIGTYLIATHGRLDNLSLSTEALVWGLISAVSLAFYTVYPRELMKRFGTVEILGWSMFLSGVALIGIAKPWNMIAQLTPMDIGILVFLIVGGTVTAFLIYSIGVGYIGGTQANILATIEPLTSALLSFVVLGVRFELFDYLGFICIISITFLFAMEKSRPETVVHLHK